MAADTQAEVTKALRHWYTTGNVTNYRDLKRHVDNGTEPPVNLLLLGPIRPEKDLPSVSMLPEEPPRYGGGATKKAWAEFALAVADIEEEVVARMGRNDIIKMLEVKGVIDRVTED